MVRISVAIPLLRLVAFSANIDAGSTMDVRTDLHLGPPESQDGGGQGLDTGVSSGADVRPDAQAPSEGRWTPSGPCVAAETTRYRVTYGILGQVALARLRLLPEVPPEAGSAAALWVRATGDASGDILGLGKTNKRIESEFDARSLTARRWKSVMAGSGRVTADTGEQAQPGAVDLLRKRTDENDRAESFRRSASVLDPMSFLLHLRVALPQSPAVYEVLDGRALWLVSVSPARPDARARGLLRVDGKLDPIYWDGNPDRGRRTFTFSLYFTSDRFRTPMRLVIPFAIGEVRAELVQLDRDRPVTTPGTYDCREPPLPGFWRWFNERWAGVGRLRAAVARWSSRLR